MKSSFFFLSFVAIGGVSNVLVEATLNRPADPVLAAENIPPPAANLPIKVGCYYYPWHADDFHRDDEYLRDYLVPRQEPSMGEYDDRKPEVIKEHLRMSRQANCRVWIASWFGKGSREDTTLLNNVLPTVALDDPDHRIAIHYETFARVRQLDRNNLFNLDDPTGNTVTHYFSINGKANTPDDGVFDDMVHFCNNYFNHPNYYHIQGRPVIVLYLSRALDSDQLPGVNEDGGGDFYWAKHELLEAMVSEMREGALKTCGKDPYIVGDQIFNVFNADRDGRSMEALDAITNYDVYGHMDQDRIETANGYAAEEIDEFYAIEQAVWKTEANKRNCAYIPGVTPGFNDRAVRLRKKSDGSEAKPLSRSIRPGALEGSLFAHMIQRARGLVDPSADYLMGLTSFNEIHEDTQIEPMVVDRMARALLVVDRGTPEQFEAQKVTNQAFHIWNSTRTGYLNASVYTVAPPTTDLTQGFAYEAYYDLYLNILRSTTVAPFYVAEFDSVPTSASLFDGARYISAPSPVIKGTQSLELIRTGTSPSPRFRIDLGTRSAISSYNFLVIEFMFYSQRSEANEFFRVKCLNNVNNVDSVISEEKWGFGQEFDQHRKAYYAVTECKINTVANQNRIVLEFVYEPIDSQTSIIIDSVKVTGLSSASVAAATPVPTSPATKAPTPSPTLPPLIFANQNFESSFGVFRDGGTDCDRITYASDSIIRSSINDVSPGGGGLSCIRLRDNSGTASSMFTGAQTVSGYNSLTLEFDYYAHSFETGEDFMVEWKIAGGTGWTLEERWVKGTNIVEGRWLRAVVGFDAWVAQGKPSRIDIRIRVDASEDNDILYVDNVIFRGNV